MTESEGRGLAPRLVLAAAIAAFAFPMYAFAHWIMVFDGARPRDEVLRDYLAGFPYTWRSPGTITVLSVLGCALAVLLARLARRRLPRGAWTVTATLLIVIAAVLGAWNLFTMM